MTEKRFTTVELPKPNRWGIWYDGAYLSTYQVCILLNEYVDVKKENEQLKEALIELKEIGDYQYVRIKELSEENEQLKQELYDCKKDKKQLSISFMEFKMQLVEVLQQNYNYAYNQRQKNLDKTIVARTYEVLYQTIDNIAETMNVDIERFPKGDVE